MHAEFLKDLPTWFLVFLVVMSAGVISLLFGYFLFSMKQMFAGLQLTLKELKDLIKELFEDRNDHSTRITALETWKGDYVHMCDERHKNHERAK